MAEMIAVCGNNCADCEAYIATLADDSAAFEEIARKWSEKYGGQCVADDCVCDGCTSGKWLSTAYAKACPIRICAESKGMPNCAFCENFICEKLQKFLQFAPELRERLVKIRAEVK